MESGRVGEPGVVAASLVELGLNLGPGLVQIQARLHKGNIVTDLVEILLRVKKIFVVSISGPSLPC